MTALVVFQREVKLTSSSRTSILEYLRLPSFVLSDRFHGRTRPERLSCQQQLPWQHTGRSTHREPRTASKRCNNQRAPPAQERARAGESNTQPDAVLRIQTWSHECVDGKESELIQQTHRRRRYTETKLAAVLMESGVERMKP